MSERPEEYDYLTKVVQLVARGKKPGDCTDVELDKVYTWKSKLSGLPGIDSFLDERQRRISEKEDKIRKTEEKEKIDSDNRFQIKLVVIVAAFGAVFGLLTGVFNAATTKLIES